MWHTFSKASNDPSMSSLTSACTGIFSIEFANLIKLRNVSCVSFAVSNTRLLVNASSCHWLTGVSSDAMPAGSSGMPSKVNNWEENVVKVRARARSER